MGALHQGHASLMERSIRETNLSIVSIFLNPKQFGPKEDLKRYPRTWADDCRMLARAGVEILFAPNQNSMYPIDYSTEVSVANLTETLCGDRRFRGPRHFIGVTTVVSKLFNVVRPTRAYFGMKDFQQLRVIEQMTKDLNFGIDIVRCPTIRERDGLALSSRNSYLSKEERRLAPALYQSLQHGRKLLRSFSHVKPRIVCQKVKHHLLSRIPHSKIDYIELVDPKTLQRVDTGRRPSLLAAAIWLGRTRLIDNILVA